MDFTKTVGMFNEMVEDQLKEDNPAGTVEFLEQSIVERKDKWTFPPKGWFKINTDVACKNGLATISMVVRDDLGGLMFIKTKLVQCKNAWCAEIAALNWAAGIAEEKGWYKAQWSSDAKGVTELINSKEEPEARDSYYDILQIRERFARSFWSLEWSPRSANKAADSIASFSFDNNAEYCFNCFDFDLLPQNLKQSLVNDLGRESVV